MQLASPAALHGLAVITDRARAPFALELSTGKRVTTDYLAAHNVSFDAVYSVSASVLTDYAPRVLIVDHHGVVRHHHLGRLESSGAREFVDVVRRLTN